MFNSKYIAKSLVSFVVATIFLCNSALSAPIPKPPNPNIKSYVLMDFDSGMIIASKNPDAQIPPASITKIMTSYIAFLELQNNTPNMNEDVLISKKAWKTDKIFIEVGKKVKVSDLLHGIITSSGNDASVAKQSIFQEMRTRSQSYESDCFKCGIEKYKLY